jgi:hypothetical protein
VTSSLSDPPGLDPGAPRHRRRRRRRRPRPFRRGEGYELPPINLQRHQAEDSIVFRQKQRHIPWGTIFATLVAAGTVALVATLTYRATRVEVQAKGIEDGAALTPLEAAGMQVTFVLPSHKVATGSQLSFDGKVVAEPKVFGAGIVWRAGKAVSEGRHHLDLRVPRAVLDDAHFRWDFVVDGKPPVLFVAPSTKPVAIDAEAEVTGYVEPGARLTVSGDRTAVDEDGRFRLHYDQPPTGPLAMVATDRAGNTATATVVVPVRYPALRGVHVTAAAWGNEQLRNGILAMIDQHRIDTVQLDLKDESGIVGFDTGVARAARIGAVTRHYDLDTAVLTLHARHVRVVGRISAFRDPVLARAAWGAGQRDQVIQTAAGGLYDDTGPYTNPANLAVRRYNLDIARDAVARGVDDILWDDARLPTSQLDTIRIPGLTGSPSDAVVGFLAEAHDELRRRGAYQGVAVDGEAADKGDSWGQDVARVARNADYVAPEIYPAYWSADSFGVASPIHQPGDLVKGVLANYRKVTAGSGTVLVPWLQNFTIEGVTYGDTEVRSQILGARSLGVRRFLLWSPTVRYSAGALDPQR